MDLTEWWLAFAADLDNLATKVKDSQTEYWLAARAMIAAGVQIENNLLRGVQYAAKIDAASKKLGAAFKNAESNDTMYLPDAHSPESFVFAFIYYQHLVRYQTIDQAKNPLVLKKLTNRRGDIKCAAEEVKQRMDRYWADSKSFVAITTCFPGLVLRPQTSYIEQLKQWFAGGTLEEKFIQQLERQLESIKNLWMERCERQQLGTKMLFAAIDQLLQDKLAMLRDIAAQKKLIELLMDGTLIPADLSATDKLRNNYPVFADYWIGLDAHAPYPGLINRLFINLMRLPVETVRFAGRLLSVLAYWSVGWLTPQGFYNLAANLVWPLGSVTNAMIPASLAERRKQQLIIQANRAMVATVAQLNADQATQITAHDFKNMAASGVSALADKLKLFQSMITLKGQLLMSQQEPPSERAKKRVAKLLVPSFFHHLACDKALLTQEVERLRNQVEEKSNKSGLKKKITHFLKVDKKQVGEVPQGTLRNSP